jgi:hypothetical protein
MRQDELIMNAGRRRPAAGGCARRADIRSSAASTVVGASGLTMTQMASGGGPSYPRPYPGRRRAPESVIRRDLRSSKSAMREGSIRFLLTLASAIGGTATFAQTSPPGFNVADAARAATAIAAERFRGAETGGGDLPRRFGPGNAAFVASMQRPASAEPIIGPTKQSRRSPMRQPGERRRWHRAGSRCRIPAVDDPAYATGLPTVAGVPPQPTVNRVHRVPGRSTGASRPSVVIRPQWELAKSLGYRLGKSLVDESHAVDS